MKTSDHYRAISSKALSSAIKAAASSVALGGFACLFLHHHHDKTSVAFITLSIACFYHALRATIDVLFFNRSANLEDERNTAHINPSKIYVR